jgi:hypothetical protein
MSCSYAVAARPARRGEQETVTKLSRHIFYAAPPFARFPAHVLRGYGDRKPQPFSQRPDELCVVIRLLPSQTMVQVSYVKIDDMRASFSTFPLSRDPHEHIEQRNRIRPARHRHHNPARGA